VLLVRDLHLASLGGGDRAGGEATAGAVPGVSSRGGVARWAAAAVAASSAGVLVDVPHVARVVHVKRAVAHASASVLVLNSGASRMVLACKDTFVEADGASVLVVRILFALSVRNSGPVTGLPATYFTVIALRLG